MWEDLRRTLEVNIGNNCEKCGSPGFVSNPYEIVVTEGAVEAPLECASCEHKWLAIYGFSHRGVREDT